MRSKLTTLLLAICLLPGIFSFPMAAQTRNISVKGTVTDTKGEPLVGVMVYVQGSTSNGSLTGADGKYSLSGVSSQATLVASFMGYEEVQEDVDGRGVIDFVLKEDAELLEEAVAIGYGNQRKLTLTGSVASTSGTELVKNSSVNLSQGLAGRLSGVIVNNRSGEPGKDEGDGIRRNASDLCA